VGKELRGGYGGDADGLLAEAYAGAVFSLVARFESVDDRRMANLLGVAGWDVQSLERWGLVLKRANWRLAAEVDCDSHLVSFGSGGSHQALGYERLHRK